MGVGGGEGTQKRMVRDKSDTKNPQVLVSDTKISCLACKLHSTQDDGTRDISSTQSGGPRKYHEDNKVIR